MAKLYFYYASMNAGKSTTLLQADFNYTFSKSIDWTSQAERLATSGGNNNAQIINSWVPGQLRGLSDFDMTHQINANWVWDLPVGHGKRFLANAAHQLRTPLAALHANRAYSIGCGQARRRPADVRRSGRGLRQLSPSLSRGIGKS